MGNLKKALYPLVAAGLFVLTFTGTASAAPERVTTAWKFQLEHLLVAKAQEDGVFEDGDEPYFVVIRFNTQYKTTNSTEDYWSGELNEDWAQGIDTGDERDIPPNMGQVDFTSIDIITRDDYYCRNIMPEGGGVLIVAMEHDLTPWSLVAEIMNNLRNAITTELINLIENGQLDVNNPEQQVQDAVKRIVDKTSPDFWKSAEIVAKSFGNPDDLIGHYVFLFGAADPRVKTELNIPVVDRATLDVFTDLRYAIGATPLVFEGDNARYEVTAALTAITPVPAEAITGLQLKGPSSLRANTPAGFTVTINTGRNVIFDWDWGDGSKPDKCTTATHTYSVPGTYPVKVTASSNGQPVVSQSITVQVTMPPPPTKTTLYLPTIRNGKVVD